MKTLIGIVLDESSSMWCRKAEVLNGFNRFIEDQKKITDDSARLYLVKFNSNVNVIYKGIRIEDLTPMTESDYQPSGSTALYDAIRNCVLIMDQEKRADERAICVIMTDGEENCSQFTTSRDMRRIIKTHEQKNDWTFLYIGVEIAEWVKRSGMRATHCSPGFTPIYSPPQQPFQSPQTLVAHLAGTLNWVNPNPNLQVPQRHQNLPQFNRFRDSNESEEMDLLSSAIRDFRSCPASSADDPFNLSR